MAMLKIYNATYLSGVDIATPKTFTVELMDVDSQNTQRTANGTMVRDVIRSRVRKIQMDFPALTRDEMQTLLTAVNAEASFSTTGITDLSGTVTVGKGFFVLEYPDPLSTANHKRIFYVGDRKVPMFDFSRGLWEGAQFSLIER